MTAEDTGSRRASRPGRVTPRPDWPARPRIAIVGIARTDDRRTEVARAVEQIDAALTKLECERLPLDWEAESDLSKLPADLVLNLGGDGSLLGLTRRLHGNDVPVVGINFGKFGFLTEFEFEEFLGDLDAIIAGRFKTRERYLVGGRVRRDGELIHETVALNDLVISRSHYSRIVRLSVYYDGYFCTDYHADGLILASGAGSTAHSLSAGGPILIPTLDAYVITPIAPHALTVRPLVVSAHCPLEVVVGSADGDAVALTVDGQENVDLHPGDILEVYRPAQPLQLVRGRRTFFETLRSKLNWAGHGNLNRPTK